MRHDWVSATSRLSSILLGEFPPPAPRACFGRDELIEKIVGFAENFEPVSLIGTGGIGKTSIALTVLHHIRVKEKFGNNRRFIRCDQFPASSAHFLARLSKVIGAGVENPESLAPLRPFLSSQRIFIILDNAESILDPHGTDAQVIYALVDELCQFETMCLCITSRITTVPRHCKRPVIPTLSREAACNIFYNIYDDGGRSDVINDLLQRLDFHPLSITLLATTASHNRWGYDELAKEWDTRRAQVLRTEHNESLAATIELSLASPTFRKLCPNARDLLGVIAFFPQGINKTNLDWLFPTIPDRKNIFDKLCVLSLTHRSNDFITMLAPIRDYFRPQDPKSSPLLCAAKGSYFARLSVRLDPDQPGFGDAQWITSEDVNVEHLLDSFTSVNTDTGDVWVACVYFMQHLYWHKPRRTVLGTKIEGLPDEHRSKPDCLFELSRLFQSIGNRTEQKRLLFCILGLKREEGSDRQVAQLLGWLSTANRLLGLYEEGIRQAEEALEILGQLGDIEGQAKCLKTLAWLLYEDKRIGDAEEAIHRAIKLLPKKGQEFQVCQSHRLLGLISRSQGEKDEAIYNFRVAFEIASAFNWDHELFWIHYSLASLFFGEGEFDDALTHIEQAKSHVAERPYCLGRAMVMQVRIWYRQRKLADAGSEALRALEIFEKLGAEEDREDVRELLQKIGRATQRRPCGSVEPGPSGELQERTLFYAH